MKYFYLASGEFGAEVLKNLQPRPSLVITQPDRIGGRGLTTKIPTPVKTLSQQLKLPILQNIQRLSLEKLKVLDLALVADFGEIIEKKLLEQPKHGFWNIHPSLLPKYRGTSPVVTAILNNEKYTGVSIIKVDEKVDHGPLISQEQRPIKINDTRDVLSTKLAKLGAIKFNEIISQQSLDNIQYKNQNHEQATFTKKLVKQDGYIPIEQLASCLKPILSKYNLLHLISNIHHLSSTICSLELHNKIRALNPWPGVWTRTKSDRTIKLLSSYYHVEKGEVKLTRIQINNKVYNFE